jgi:hypothetical protein
MKRTIKDYFNDGAGSSNDPIIFDNNDINDNNIIPNIIPYINNNNNNVISNNLTIIIDNNNDINNNNNNDMNNNNNDMNNNNININNNPAIVTLTKESRYNFSDGTKKTLDEQNAWRRISRKQKKCMSPRDDYLEYHQAFLEHVYCIHGIIEILPVDNQQQINHWNNQYPIECRKRTMLLTTGIPSICWEILKVKTLTIDQRNNNKIEKYNTIKSTRILHGVNIQLNHIEAEAIKVCYNSFKLNLIFIIIYIFIKYRHFFYY